MDLNVAARNQAGGQKKKCYNCDKERYFVKDCRQPKKLPWKPVSQKNANIADVEHSIAMVERIPSFFNFNKRMPFILDYNNTFISIPLNVSDIEQEKELDTDESEEFNADVQTHLAPEGEHKEFTVIRVNLNTARNNGEEHPYNEDDPYLEPNNVKHHSIIWINCIYNYCAFHLESKATNNFFPRAIFKSMRRAYTFEKTKHWILTIKTTMYGTFISSSKHPPICIKEGATLERCQESSYLEHYFEKVKEQYRNRNKNDEVIIIQNWLKKVKSYKNVKKVKKKKNNNLKKIRIKIPIK